MILEHVSDEALGPPWLLAQKGHLRQSDSAIRPVRFEPDDALEGCLGSREIARLQVPASGEPMGWRVPGVEFEGFFEVFAGLFGASELMQHAGPVVVSPGVLRVERGGLAINLRRGFVQRVGIQGHGELEARASVARSGDCDGSGLLDRCEHVRVEAGPVDAGGEWDLRCDAPASTTRVVTARHDPEQGRPGQECREANG